MAGRMPVGVPAVLVPVSHWDAMFNAASAKVIGELAREKLTRWSEQEVNKARQVLFGEPPPPPPAFMPIDQAKPIAQASPQPRRPGIIGRRFRQ